MNKSYECFDKFRNSSISAVQLKELKSDITPACYQYLLGKMCYCEHEANPNIPWRVLFMKLGETFNLTESSLRRYMSYKVAMERLHEMVPELVPKIIEGNARLSVVNAITASHMSANEIRSAMKKLQDDNIPINSVFPERWRNNTTMRLCSSGKADSEPKQTVKDTPAFDPEAQISGISFTIPTWVSAIDRAFTATDFLNISLNARYRFLKELTTLKAIAEVVLDMLREESR